MDMPSAFNLTVRLDNVAVITIDVPDEKMNTLKAEFGVQVRAMLKQIRDNKAIRGLVFISAKPDNFIAGADINMIARAQSALEAEELARQGQQVMAEINGLPIPVIAAIHGACLGGGLELALACENDSGSAGSAAGPAAWLRRNATAAAPGGRQHGAGDDLNR